MNKYIKSQAHRKLRHLENYISLVDKELPHDFNHIDLQAQEEIIGIYKNETKKSSEAILLTTRAIYVKEARGIISIMLGQIKSFNSPSSNEKYVADSLVVYLKTGETITIPIRGGKGNLRDIWAFVSFFRKIVK